MRTLIVTVAVVLLAGCGHMGMQEQSSGMGMQSSGGMQSSSSGASGSTNLTEREVFQSWLD
jgi:hypothetical protein